jgi:glucose-6-phosphate 1-dehydrogenase
VSPAKVADGANPLRDARDRRLPRIAGPCGLVIFGVTGDLARKKLMPAVYDLTNRGLLPPGFALTGFARRDWANQDFAKIVHDSVKEHARTPFREATWRQLSEGIRFVQGTFDDDDAFDRLRDTVEELDVNRGTGGNHAFYLSIPPSAFPVVCKQLARSGLSQPQDGTWRRVVIEKPFGHDLASARELQGIVSSVFNPDDIFRIDHYLGKETVQNLLALRFANGLFEPLWNRNHIASVQITAGEAVGLEGRAGYYDNAGALRDLVQNHLLQLLCILAMEPPTAFAADDIRTEKVKVLRAIDPIDPSRVDEVAVRGRYGPGAVGGAPGGGDTPHPGRPAPPPTSRTCPPTRRPRPSPRCGCRSTPGAGPGFRSTSAPASASRAS